MLKKFLNNKKVKEIIKVIFLIIMIVLIYLVSPKITQLIQNIAQYLYEIDSNYITRVVELMLSVSFIFAVKEGGQQENGRTNVRSTNTSSK